MLKQEENKGQSAVLRHESPTREAAEAFNGTVLGSRQIVLLSPLSPTKLALRQGPQVLAVDEQGERKISEQFVALEQSSVLSTEATREVLCLISLALVEETAICCKSM